jgi:hypothetical protein
MYLFGFLNYWDIKNGWWLFAISVFVALSAFYNVLFSRHSSRRKLGIRSMGPFACRETYTYDESDPQEARGIGYFKMVCLILFHQVYNIIYLCNR